MDSLTNDHGPQEVTFSVTTWLNISVVHRDLDSPSHHYIVTRLSCGVIEGVLQEGATTFHKPSVFLCPLGLLEPHFRQIELRAPSFHFQMVSSQRKKGENRINVLSFIMRPILTYGSKSTYYLLCDSFLREGLLLIAKTLNVKITHAHKCSPFVVEIWAWHSHYHVRQTSHHISCELSYMLSMQ